MLASDLSPFAMTFLAVCGGSSIPGYDDPPTSTGFSCWDYQKMVDVELILGQECAINADCDQVIELSDSCPTADPVLRGDFDAIWLIDLLEEAESVGCSIEFGPPGDCDADAEPICSLGSCGWD